MATTRVADVFVQGTPAGTLKELDGGGFVFEYLDSYDGSPISHSLPISTRRYEFDSFPAFFDGLLPEGWQLEALLQTRKLDRSDRMGQLLAVGKDTVGAVTVEGRER